MNDWPSLLLCHLGRILHQYLALEVISYMAEDVGGGGGGGVFVIWKKKAFCRLGEKMAVGKEICRLGNFCQIETKKR